MGIVIAAVEATSHTARQRLMQKDARPIAVMAAPHTNPIATIAATADDASSTAMDASLTTELLQYQGPAT